MKLPVAFAGSMAVAVLGLSFSSPAAADPYYGHHHHHHHHYYAREGHGRCLRFNKTTGTVTGVVGGGLIGHALVGGPGGLLVGAAAGGLAGHELAHNGRKHCR